MEQVRLSYLPDDEGEKIPVAGDEDPFGVTKAGESPA
jgi:hypothetical protein